MEDDSLFRNTLSRVIDHSQGFSCAHALESSEEAIARLEQSRPPQVILMDIMLPGMDGIQGSSRIKEMSPSTNILILTNYADNDKIFRALCAGASGYLLKTSSPEEIRRAIQGIILEDIPRQGSDRCRCIGDHLDDGVIKLMLERFCGDQGLNPYHLLVRHFASQQWTAYSVKKLVLDRWFEGIFIQKLNVLHFRWTHNTQSVSYQ